MSERLSATLAVLASILACPAGVAASGAAGQAPDAVIFHVSPAGNDNDAGDSEHPFNSLEKAQQAVRALKGTRDIAVRLASGTYRLTRPLIFTAADGGRNGHRVEWAAEPGAAPVISGAIAVSHWRLFDRRRHIYVAEVPAGLDSRQLWVNDQLAQRAAERAVKAAFDHRLIEVA